MSYENTFGMLNLLLLLFIIIGKDPMKPDVEGNFLEPLRSIKKGNISILLQI